MISLLTLVVSLSFAQSSVETYQQIGKSAERQSEWPKAINAYKKVLSKMPGDDVANLGVVRSYLAMGKLEDADKTAREFLAEVNPFNVEMRVLHAEALQKKGLYDDALKELAVGEKVRPNYSPSIERKGLILFDQKKYSQAADLFSAHLRENPSNWGIRFRRAQAYIHENKPDMALADLKWLTDEKPGNSDATLLYAEALTKKREYPQAERVLKQLVKVNPLHKEAIMKIGDLLSAQGRFDEAISYFRMMMELDPTNVEVQYKIGTVFLNRKQFNVAEDEFQKILRKNPGYEPAAQSLVEAWTTQKHNDKVGGFLAKYSANYPKRMWATKKYAQMLIEVGQTKLAEEVCDRAVSKNEMSPDLAVWAGFVYGSVGNYKEGISILTDVAKDHPKNDTVLYNLASLYEGKGELGKAIETLRKIPPEAPSYSKVVNKLSEIETKMKAETEPRSVSSEKK